LDILVLFKKKLAPYHITFEGNLDEITEEKIVTLVGNASMNKSRVLEGNDNQNKITTLKFTEKKKQWIKISILQKI